MTALPLNLLRHSIELFSLHFKRTQKCGLPFKQTMDAYLYFRFSDPPIQLLPNRRRLGLPLLAAELNLFDCSDDNDRVRPPSDPWHEKVLCPDRLVY
jgi:hypothetical protein